MAKAKKTMVAVHDENGRLVGTVDPDHIQRIDSPSAPSSAGSAVRQPNGAPVDANDGPAAEASDTADDVAKALRRLPLPDRQTIAKSAATGSVDDQYERLLKGLPSSVAAEVTATVAMRATSLAIRHRLAGPAAVTIVKGAALDGARRAGRGVR